MMMVIVIIIIIDYCYCDDLCFIMTDYFHMIATVVLR